MEKQKPHVGDIWRWHGDGDGNSWTVLLLRQIDSHNFYGVALEDGWHGNWAFAAEFGGKLAGWWEYMA